MSYPLTMLVDSSGNPIGVAGNPLAVDASVTIAGGATAANQATEIARLTTIAAAVSGTEMQVDVVSSAMPSGAATAANQATELVRLATLAGAVAGTEMQVDVVGALPAGTNAIGKLVANDGVDVGDVTVNNASAAGVYVRPGDGASFAVTGTFWQATQPVSLASVPSHAVTNAGTFAVQAAQSGAWTVTAEAGTNLNTSALALESGGNIATVKTNTDPLVASGGGGYVRQDSTATIAKETGGNLAALLAAIAGGLTPPTIDSYASVAISANADTANQPVLAAPGANKQIWGMMWYGTPDTGDGSIAFQDEDDTAITGVMEVAQATMYGAKSDNPLLPLFKVATNKALEIDTVTCGFKGQLNYFVVSV